MLRPMRPDKLRGLLVHAGALGPQPGGGQISRPPASRTSRRSSTSSARSPSREVHARTNALAHALADAGVSEGDGVGIMCRNHRGFIEATVAVVEARRRRALPQHRVRGPQLTEVVEREKPVALIYDEEFTELLADAAERRKRFVAWHDSDAARRSDARRADRDGRPRRRRAARPRGPHDDPHLGHDRHAEGRVAREPAVARPGGVAAVEDPAPARARPTLVAAPLFHSWGFAHFTLGLFLGSHLRPAAQVRPRGSAWPTWRATAPTCSSSCR